MADCIDTGWAVNVRWTDSSTYTPSTYIARVLPYILASTYPTTFPDSSSAQYESWGQDSA